MRRQSMPRITLPVERPKSGSPQTEFLQFGATKECIVAPDGFPEAIDRQSQRSLRPRLNDRSNQNIRILLIPCTSRHALANPEVASYD